MTTQNDPWATASDATAAATVDPNADPFASPDQVGGPSGPRGPQGFAGILNRLIVLKPIEKLLDQPVTGDTTGKTQNVYVCNLTVLGGEPVEVYSPARTGDNGVEYAEHTEIFETPYTWERWYSYGKGVEVKLDGVAKLAAAGGAQFLLGVVKRCPTGPGYRKGETPDVTEKRWDGYVAALQASLAAGRPAPEKPMFSWGIVDPDADQRAQALAWYRGQR